MNYNKTITWLFEQLPMYQRVGKTAYKADLSNTIKLVNYLKNPEKKFKSIHVAGTNGKGSTSHMLASILQEAGYKVGLYTSPHLKDFRERIKINGEMIPKRTVSSFVTKNQSFFEAHKFSFFEMTVGLAFDYFSKEKVDIAVIEVGMGGRLDSTNVITPEVSVITNIGLDHTQFLGDTIAQIASEKAGIIKKGIPVVIGEFQKETEDVFRIISEKKNAPLYWASDFDALQIPSDLKGEYQIKNNRTAQMVVDVLQEKGYAIGIQHVAKGLGNVVNNTGLLGRWQLLKETPKVICDTAHNKEGLQLVMKQLKKEKYGKLHFVLGVVNDKDIDAVLSLFPKGALYYFCKPDVPRGLDALVLQKQANVFGLKGDKYSSVTKAYKAALKNANSDDLVYVGGSTFVVAEVV
ncbi:bifunctional folylpolyglutamate synthase/dihydrofolate synthase [Patiriisocius hiemis]|uniref:Dihydrofolate synthase/folylpolyglutamate synthase n=1 Tax=Patiriisocius hiemis TaxID=3075604 RepID=A0ABU2YIP0_9FLAO|nr:folylpolyglutamate synthase/dihydrofolate synthase family protein [Constantimarinum sp. W242]MDT0556933.1 folylpolyglutamate synthase/dihydrofolate synthase family protein [Constantimarinum sp. W242]